MEIENSFEDRRVNDRRLCRIEIRLDYLGSRIDDLTLRIMFAVISAVCGAMLVALEFVMKMGFS